MLQLLPDGHKTHEDHNSLTGRNRDDPGFQRVWGSVADLDHVDADPEIRITDFLNTVCTGTVPYLLDEGNNNVKSNI